MSCPVAHQLGERLLTGSAEEALRLGEELESHRRECPLCQALWGELGKTLRQEVPSSPLLLARWMREAERAGEEAGWVEFPFGHPPPPPEKERGTLLRWGWKVAVPAAAALLVIFLLLLPSLPETPFPVGILPLREFRSGEEPLTLRGLPYPPPELPPSTIPGFEELALIVQPPSAPEALMLPLPSEELPLPHSSLDSYRFTFRLREAGYLYIFQLDSRGTLFRLFPHPQLTELENPLAGGETYVLPPGNRWFSLDGVTGAEEVVFLLSATPRPDVELSGELSAEEGATLRRRLLEEGYTVRLLHR